MSIQQVGERKSDKTRPTNAAKEKTKEKASEKNKKNDANKSIL